ncbi:hypothetical protein DL770_001910 [Monosporascus sp. CRB-9-2]|nr:hypothetical protein DL770_001910 [Monosporascus sp. CRB-9-2]
MGSSTPKPIRLAILEADTPAPGIQANYGSYGSVFTYLFERACSGLDPPQLLSSQLELSFHNIVDNLNAYPDPETIDAVLITGSKASAFENDEWIVRLTQYTRRVLEEGRVRVIGVCFGHQIIGRALGAKVARCERGWELSVTEVELNEEGKEFFGLEKLRIHQMHRDAVLTHPPGVKILARTNICDTQVFYSPKRLISVQGHPEFTEDMVREILEKRRYGGIITDILFKDGMRRVGDEHDGVAVAKLFLKFLRE